jgi:hypothetical protein
MKTLNIEWKKKAEEYWLKMQPIEVSKIDFLLGASEMKEAILKAVDEYQKSKTVTHIRFDTLIDLITNAKP